MSVEILLEQALREGRFYPFSDEGWDARARATLLARLVRLQGAEVPVSMPLWQVVQNKGAELAIQQRDANLLYFCDQLFEYCQTQSNLEPQLLEVFLHLRPLLAGVLLHDSAIEDICQHPLICLLDRLWDAANYWSPALGRQGEKYLARLEEMLVRLRTADPASAPFGTWLDELASQLDKELQRADVLAKRICDAERSALAGQSAERVVRRQVDQLLARMPVAEPVERLLKGPFRHSLQMAYLSQGADSEAYLSLVQTAELLQDSMVAPDSEEARQRMYQLIPKLPGMLSRQLTSIGDPAELEEWLGEIEKLHMQMLLDSKVELRQAEPLSIVDEQGGVSTNVSAALLAQVASIQEGQWLVYRKDDGENVRCRLALKIGETGQLLFVNVLGAKILEKNLEEFAYLLAAGHVLLLSGASNFSQLVRDSEAHILQLFQRQSMLQAEAAERQRIEQERRRLAKEKAQREAEQIAHERLLAHARAEEEARRQLEEQARRAEEKARKAAEEARMAAEEAQRAAEEAAMYAKAQKEKDAVAEAERQRKAQEAERERHLLEEKQARINEWEEAAQSVRSLGVGAWMDIDIQGERQRCKLAAVINASDKLIFVGRDGRKLVEPKRDELIQWLLDNKATIVARGDQFENSLAKVIQTLRKD